MHIGPLCPGAHVVVRTDNEGFPTMTRSAVKLSNSPDGVLFCNTSTKWVKRTAAVVVLVGGGLPVLVAVMDEDEDEVSTADSLYSRIKLSSTFFPTSTDDTLTVYSTIAVALAEFSVLAFFSVTLLELSVVGLFW